MLRYVITGAPGTGKTSILEALAHIGDVVAEPARELIAEHRYATGERSLDESPELFVNRLIARSIEKFDAAQPGHRTFFDRGLPDCIAYASVFGVDTRAALAAAQARRYADRVFVAPPWEEIYTTDDMRQATYRQVVTIHNELVAVYERLDYELVELPRESVAERAKLVASMSMHPSTSG